MIKLFVIDDHHIFRDGLRMLFESIDDIEIVGEAESGDQAMQNLESLEQEEGLPNLILMDIQMPEENGIDLTYRVKARFPNINVLMLTMFEDEQSVFAAMQAGACGYILKGIKRDEMMRSIQIAGEGGAIFSPRVANLVMSYFTGLQAAGSNSVAQQEVDKTSLPELSQREREVVSLLAEGADNHTIARKLILTPKTVRNYVSQVLKKLEVQSRDEATIRTRIAGLT